MITQVNSGVLNVHKAHMNNNTKKEAKNTSQKQNVSVRDEEASSSSENRLKKINADGVETRLIKPLLQYQGRTQSHHHLLLPVTETAHIIVRYNKSRGG